MIGTRTIPLNCRIVQKQGNIVSDMDGDKVMFNIHNGSYYNLGTTGGRIWELTGTPTSAARLIEMLMSEYEVGYSECEDHVVGFLMHLHDEHLIEFGEELHA